MAHVSLDGSDPTTPRSPDTDLIQASVELDFINAKIAKIAVEGGGIDLEDIPAAVDLNTRRDEVLDTLCETEARTIAGVEAKAQALRTPDLIADYERHGALAVSLAEDIARLAKVRASVEREPPPGTMLTVESGPGVWIAIARAIPIEGKRLFKLATGEFDAKVAALGARGVEGAALEEHKRRLRRELRLDALFELTGDDICASSRTDASSAPPAGASDPRWKAYAAQHPGFVPCPADDPVALVALKLAIPMEARRLLDLADVEFERREHAYAGDSDPTVWPRLAVDLRREMRMDLLEQIAAPLPTDARDPVLAAIAASRSALAEHTAACNAPGSETPAGDTRRAAAREAAHTAWLALLSTRPTTVAGVQALACYLVDHIRSGGSWDQHLDADALTLFRTIGTAILRSGGGQGQDFERDRALDDALTRHRIANRDFLSAANAADAVLVEKAGGDTSDAAMAPLEAASIAAGELADQAWRDIFRMRPHNFEGFWGVLHHVREYGPAYEEISNPPDIIGTLYAAACALRAAPKLVVSSYDLGQLGVADLEALAEICQLQAEGLNTAGYLPLCNAPEGYTHLGEIIDREWNRMAILRDLAVSELETRQPADDEERDARLTTLIRQDLLCKGRIEPKLLAEAAEAWRQSGVKQQALMAAE